MALSLAAEYPSEGQLVTAKKQTPLAGAKSEMERSLENLLKSVEELQNKMQPVLMPVPSGELGKDPANVAQTSEVIDFINSKTETIRLITRDINNIIDQIYL